MRHPQHPGPQRPLPQSPPGLPSNHGDSCKAELVSALILPCPMRARSAGTVQERPRNGRQARGRSDPERAEHRPIPEDGRRRQSALGTLTLPSTRAGCTSSSRQPEPHQPDSAQTGAHHLPTRQGDSVVVTVLKAAAGSDPYEGIPRGMRSCPSEHRRLSTMQAKAGSAPPLSA